MRAIHAAAAALIAGVLLAACGESDGTRTTPADTTDGGDDAPSGNDAAGAAAQNSFDGEWELVAGTGPGGELTLVNDVVVTLQIDGEELGGKVCNHYSATMTRNGDDVSIQTGAMTDMGCQDDLMALETAYHEALSAVTSATRDDGQLVLAGPDVELRFTEIPPIPTEELIGTTWVLKTLINGETASSTMGDPATLTLHDDGTVTGSTGCREFTGTYSEYAGGIQFPEFGLTGECGEDLRDQDSHIVSVLEGFRAEVDGNTLRITSDGGTGLVYKAE